MSKPTGIVKHAVLVTIGSFVIMILSFALYFGLFMLAERLFSSPNGEFGHRFVSPLRLGYGIVWILAVLLLYRTKMVDWLKAVFLAGALATFWAGAGVQLYRNPLLGRGIVVMVVLAICILMLLRRKSAWYHYLAAGLAAAASLFYTAPG